MKRRVHVLIMTILMIVLATGTAFADNREDTEDTEEYLVGFKNEAAVQAFSNNVTTSAVEVQHEYENLPVIVSELSTEVAELLENDPSVEFIEKNEKVYLDPLVMNNIQETDIPKLEERMKRGDGVKVAVLDTGIASHDDLHVIDGVSFVSVEPFYRDLNGHGTHVAGTIAAQENDEASTGIAPNVELYAVKVLNGLGAGSIASITNGIDWAISNDMDIINMSLGTNTDSEALQRAVERAHDHGILIIAAAGNSGEADEQHTIDYPARYDSVVAVGAVDGNNDRASFSSYGEQLEIMAPGVEIHSTFLFNRYERLSGTSMASPHVTGAAALIKSNNPELTNEQIRKRLNTTATPLGNPFYYGHGLLNVDAALD
ncbi:S8 family peptidase [Halalkalibacterium halodurans]|uniref:S8 family peptidase n=1 Tax=Halalkalibacterium halodurans TaxID=86665 RepID=UPI002E1FBFDE|nr:S8 family peptidase [Halalkalibacterium halodurans]